MSKRDWVDEAFDVDISIPKGGVTYEELKKLEVEQIKQNIRERYRKLEENENE